MWVFQQAASGAPQMKTLEAIRAEVGDAFVTLYAHSITHGSRSVRISPGDRRVVWYPSILETVQADVVTFDMNYLGKFFPAWEATGEAGIECKGVLRPAFELALDGNQLEPVGRALPQNASPLCLFIKRSLKLKKGYIIALRFRISL